MLGTQKGTIILTTTQVEDGVSAPLQKAEDGWFACTLHCSFNWRTAALSGGWFACAAASNGGTILGLHVVVGMMRHCLRSIGRF